MCLIIKLGLFVVLTLLMYKPIAEVETLKILMMSEIKDLKNPWEVIIKLRIF